jgi:hypothetical protein
MSERDDRPPEPGAQEPFLRRWARRKEEARATPARQPGPTQPAPPNAAEPPAAGEVPVGQQAAIGPPDEAAGQPPELPSLESLTEDSDYSAFMRAGVSPDLRRDALRKLFRSGKYAAVDPLDPYRTDFGKYAPLGDIVTADMKFHAERLLRQELERMAEAADPDSPDTGQATASASSGSSATSPPERDESELDDQETPPEENDGSRHT